VNSALFVLYVRVLSFNETGRGLHERAGSENVIQFHGMMP